MQAIPGAEYTKDDFVWQDSTTFTGLTPNTEYTFYARMKETATHHESYVMDGSVLKTLKSPQSAPAPFTASSVTVTGVTLNAIPGAQYRLGSGGGRTAPHLSA